jgi:S-layer family protein
MRLARIFSAVLFLGASAVWASDKLPVADSTYGTARLTWETFTPWDFHPIESIATYAWYTDATTPASIYEAPGSTTNVFIASLHLPAGAIVSTFEFHACDTSVSNTLSFWLVTQPKASVGQSYTSLGDTGVSPGCALFTTNLSPPLIIDNANNFYFFYAAFGETGSALLLSSARVGYKLQVSPDPATATFADVPVGHPFHRFVEALYAAGITGGCGGGNFCPDAPITRGQMAVFLAGALGLHWAP